MKSKTALYDVQCLTPPSRARARRAAPGPAWPSHCDSDVIAHVVQRRHAVIDVDDVGLGGLVADELKVHEEAVAHVLAVLKVDAI